ncbi:MAG: tetratricopeptide repeat protein, partial [Treponema sp.]|nr:tetratricopeptide repeat protein [Treponema sp.]
HKTGGYAGSKAWSIIAQIHSRKEEWQQAEETWLKAAHKGARTYLGPIALFNAAAAAEEQGKLEQAIELLEQCLAHKFEFPAAPRAQFSIGRLNEQLGNTGAAMEAYRIVLINWADMPVWQQLARSRITALEIQ